MRTKVKVMIAFIAVIAVSFIGYNVYKSTEYKIIIRYSNGQCRSISS